MNGLLTQAADGFAAVFGYPPDGIWSAPGRVNLIGEHTDYNEGFALPFAIDRRTFAALALRDDDLVRVSSSLTDGIGEASLRDLSPAAVNGWTAYPVGVTWGPGQVGTGLAGLADFDAHSVSYVPLGAGLSSSAALESALAVALNEAWRLGFAGPLLVRATHLAENEFVGAPTGILDQSASLLAKEGAVLFIDCRGGSSTPVDLRLDESGLAVLVIDTKVKHEHASGGYAARRARHVVAEDQCVLDTVQALRAQLPEEVGRLLTASHRSMRDDSRSPPENSTRLSRRRCTTARWEQE